MQEAAGEGPGGAIEEKAEESPETSQAEDIPEEDDQEPETLKTADE